jgi:glycosyltransferase involved in cell wall biosynthesis
MTTDRDGVVSAKRLLLALPEPVDDPCSGASRSMMTIGRICIEGGWDLHVLAPSSRCLYPWVSSDYDAEFDRVLEALSPHVLLTYGGTPSDLARRRRARRIGAKVVLGLRSFGYMDRRAFDSVDAILSASRYLAERYRLELGVESTPLQLPLWPADVVAIERDPKYVVMVDPSPEKGGMVMARIAEEIGRRRPDVRMVVFESRGTGADLISDGLAGGFHLGRHPSLRLAAATPCPWLIYKWARVLVAPSVWDEPAGRVVAEALVNGVPPIVSDRGGLPEVANGGGLVLPIPSGITAATKVPPSAEEVAPWVSAILRLMDDDAAYREASRRALWAARAYAIDVVATRYLEFFERLLTSPEPSGGTDAPSPSPCVRS